jgi:hypothetical protein
VGSRRIAANPTREEVLVIAPVELIAHKMTTMIGRRGKPKAMTEHADIYRLLLAFPELKKLRGPVTDCLQALGSAKDVRAAWKELVSQNIEPEDDDDKLLEVVDGQADRIP